MSIMAKYVVSANMMNAKRSEAINADIQAHVESADLIQQRVETRWWRWQWLAQKRPQSKISVPSTAAVSS